MIVPKWHGVQNSHKRGAMHLASGRENIPARYDTICVKQKFSCKPLFRGKKDLRRMRMPPLNGWCYITREGRNAGTVNAAAGRRLWGNSEVCDERTKPELAGVERHRWHEHVAAPQASHHLDAKRSAEATAPKDGEGYSSRRTCS